MVTHATRVRRYKHLIGGEWLDPSSGKVIPRDNPATGEKGPSSQRAIRTIPAGR